MLPGYWTGFLEPNPRYNRPLNRKTGVFIFKKCDLNIWGGMKKRQVLFPFWYFLPLPNIYFSLKIKQAGQLSSKPWLSLISLIKLFLQFFFRRKLYKLRLLWMSSSTWMFPSTLSLIGSRHAIQRKEFLKISFFYCSDSGFERRKFSLQLLIDILPLGSGSYALL